MIYNDGPEMDEKLRIVKCPRCENEAFENDDKFCPVCGLSLYNYCFGDEQHINKGNARYCVYCGERTVFQFEKILKPYTTVLKEQRQQYLKEETEERGFIFDFSKDDVPF